LSAGHRQTVIEQFLSEHEVVLVATVAEARKALS
jgi:hypothetical protein